MTARDRVAVLMLSAAFCCAAPLARSGEPPFRPGETIRYHVKQGPIKAGEATLTFKGDAYVDGRKTALIVFRAKGFNFFDEERVYLDPESFLPVQVLRELNIFGNKETILEEYQQTAGRVRVTKSAHGKTTVLDIVKEAPVENLYGFLYRTRLGAVPDAGQSLALRLPTVDLTLKGEAVQPFRAAGETFAAVRFRSVPAKYTIWLDRSERRLPLRISGALGPANTVMVLTGVDQLMPGDPR